MSLLQRKLARDLLRLWSQVLTIALVVASAVGALVTTQACVHSLESARDRFYAQAHMADVFASVRRAPRLALPQFESLEGVALVQATVERPARLILPGVDDPVMGHLIGVSAADGPAGVLPGAAMIEGLVRVVEPAATTKVSALGLEEQRVNVVIDPSLPLPDGDGYSVRVRILLQQAPKALCVPLSAVFPLPGDPQRQAVFTLQDGRARLTEVTVRARGGGWAWVQRGLEVGQPVVVYPPAALTDRTRVRVVRR